MDDNDVIRQNIMGMIVESSEDHTQIDTGSKKVNLASREGRTLLYLETRCVDFGGLVAGCQMNQEDFDHVSNMKDKGLILIFERLPFHCVQYLRNRCGGHHSQSHTHYVELTEEGFKVAQILRMMRCNRLKKKYQMYRRGGSFLSYDPKRCRAEVYSESFSHPTKQCGRPCGHGPDGLFCKQHGKMAVKGNVVRVKEE